MNTLVQLTDPSFETQTAGKCDLHVEILPAGINYAVVDKGQDQLKVLYSSNFLGNTAEKIQEDLQNQSTLSYHFRKVKIRFQTSKFTFIPDELFDKSLLGEYAKFLNLDEGDTVFTDFVRSAKCVVVFAVPSDLAQSLDRQFHQPQFYHASSAMIEAGFKLSKATEDPSILLNFNGDAFEVVEINEGKLMFYNSFPCRTADEFNYFLLHLLDTLSLNIKASAWTLAGNIPEGFTERLEKYDIHFSRADKQSLLKLSETFDQLAPADFYALTALALCE